MRGGGLPHLNLTPGSPLSWLAAPTDSSEITASSLPSQRADRSGHVPARCQGAGGAHLARRAGSPGRCRGSRPRSPSRSWTARSCPARGRGWASPRAEGGAGPQGSGTWRGGGALTIHMPSKGTWAWNSATMSCHQSRASGLVKSGKALGPGHTWRRGRGGSQGPRGKDSRCPGQGPAHPLRPPGSALFPSTFLVPPPGPRFLTPHPRPLYLPDQGLPGLIGDENPPPQPLVVRPVAPRGAGAADGGILGAREGGEGKASLGTSGGGGMRPRRRAKLSWCSRPSTRGHTGRLRGGARGPAGDGHRHRLPALRARLP